MKIVLGIPAYNEEKNLAQIIFNIKKITEEIIVCDDGSEDLTSEIAKSFNVELIQHSTNIGYGGAIKSIIKKFMESDGDVLVTFDADGQHKIDDIEKVLEPIKKNLSDIVIGSRFLEKNTGIPNYRKAGIKAINRITNISTGKKISDTQSGFRAYKRSVFEKISLSNDGMGISTEILIKATKKKFKISEIPITVSYDGDTSTHNPFSHGASVIFATMKFIAVEKPLTFYGLPGIIFLVIGLYFVFWSLKIFSESGSLVINITLIAVGSILIATLLLMTASILHSIKILFRENS